MRYCSLKITAFWLVCRFLYHNLRTRILYTSGFCRKLDNYCWYIQIQKVHMNELDFCQKPQNFIFDNFLIFLEPLTYQCFSPQNWAASHFLLYNSLNLCKKSEKNDEQLLISCIATERTNELINRLRDNWTNEVKLIWDQERND